MLIPAGFARILLTISLIALVANGRTVVGQETAEQPNVEYEHLKSLEPLIGTWHGTGTDKENGMEFEFQGTFSWSAN